LFVTVGVLLKGFIQKIYAPSSSLLQDKYLPFSPSPLRLNIFRLFVILSQTQLYRYTPDIFLLSTATFKYTYRSPLRRIGQEYSAYVAWSTFQSLKRMDGFMFWSKLLWKTVKIKYRAKLDTEDSINSKPMLYKNVSLSL
jgi:hypothetical protein